MDGLGGRVVARFQVRSGEGARVAVMMLYSAAAVGAVSTVGMTVAGALFLSTIPASRTAYLLVVAGLGMLPILLLYEQVVRPFALERVATVTPLILLGVVLLLRLLLATPLGESLPVLASVYYFYEVATVLILLQFWSLAGKLFNPREARRLFGLIAGGGTLSNIIAGFSLAALGQRIGVANLLWIVAGGLLLCAACAWYLGRLGAQPSAPAGSTRRAPKPAPPSLRENLQALGRSPLLRDITLLTVLQALIINLTFYQFLLALQAHFATDGAAMVAFMGRYEVVAGVIALIVQFYLTGRIMSGFGIFGALAALPVALIFSEGLALLTGGVIVAMALIRGANPVLRRTINDAATNALFLPIPGELADRARSLTKVVYSLTFGLLGLFLILVPAATEVGYLVYAIPVMVVGAAWLLLLRRMRRHYIHALGQSLNTRQLELDPISLELEDEATRGILIAALQHPDELQVLHALQLVGSQPDPLWLPHVAGLLAHPSAEVQQEALRYLEAHGTREDAPAVAPLLEADVVGVRAAAIRAYCALAVDEALLRVPRHLADEHPATRGAAVAGLIRYTGLDGIIHAAATLKEMLRSPDASMRERATHLLSELKIRTLQGALLALFDDPVLSVRLAAIEAAVRLPEPALVPSLVGKLGCPAEGRAAARALVHFGDAALAPLEALFASQRASVRARAEVPTVFRRIGTPAAERWLLARLDETHDEMVRGPLYRALAELRGEGLLAALSVEVIDRTMMQEIRLYYEWYVLDADLARGKALPLLREAVAVRMARVLDRLLDLVELRYPMREAGQMRRALAAAGVDARAMAIELLDNVAERELRRLLLPLVEGLPSEVMQVAEQHFAIERFPVRERLAALLRHSDPWLRAVTLFYVGRDAPGEWVEGLEHALADREPLVRSTARALSRKTVSAHFSAHSGMNGFAAAILDVEPSGDSPMFSIIERVLLLKGVDLFRSFDSEELAPLAGAMEEERFEAGERFIAQDEMGTCLYILAAGEARIVIRGVGEVARRGPCDTIGEMAVISNNPRTADCIAITPLTTLRLDTTVFWELLAEKPVLAQGVIRVLAERLAEAVSNLQQLGNGTQ